jgi:hypothetical protein
MAARLTHDEAARLGIRGAAAQRLVKGEHFAENAKCSPRHGNKFGARRTDCAQGHRHASAAEARRCGELTLLERAGKIRKLEQQPKFHFAMDGRQVVDDRGRAVRYTADFRYEEQGRGHLADVWRPVVEDVRSKPTMTEAATLRLAFFRFFHPDIDVRIVA